MKSLLKVILIIALCSASTFVFVQMTGLINVEKIEIWFNDLRTLPPAYLGGFVILLMFIDLFISIPTLATVILAGHFIGYQYGALFAIIGLQIAGNTGYLLGYIFGDKILIFLLKDDQQISELRENFMTHGFFMILLSRAVPVLPEVTTCIAGMSRMPYLKFITAWSLSTVPYCLFAAYAGAQSTINDPEPAIIVWALLTSTLWIGWYFFNRARKVY